MMADDVFLYEGFATGALVRPDDSRDLQLAALPEVRARRIAGVPNAGYCIPMESVPASVKINQGSTPSCVAASICIGKSGQEFKDITRWQAYDHNELYRACGGTGQTGIYTETALKYTMDKGVLLAGGQRRYTISSYMFAPKKPREFRETLAAAILELGPIVIAMLLPINFGWNSGDGLQGAQSYHQMCGWGWEGLGDEDWLVCLNSWGEGFGNRGFVRIKWKSIETNGNFQNGYAYAYKMADFLDGRTQPPKPDPTPPRPDPPRPDPPRPDPGPSPSPIDPMEQEVIRLVNEHRRSIGVSPVAEHPGLMKSSQAKSDDMGKNNYFAHEHGGKSQLDWMREAGVTGAVVWGENIAAGQMDPSAPGGTEFRMSAERNNRRIEESSADAVIREQTPAGVFTAWLNSPGHRSNIEFKGFTSLGVGHAVVPGSQYGHYWTQHFAGLKGEGPAPDPPRPDPPRPDPPRPDPGPDPGPSPEPDKFKVEVKAWLPPRSTTRVAIVAYAKDHNGAWVSGTGRATLGGRDLGERQSSGIYQWQTTGTAGEVAVVTVTDAHGSSVQTRTTVTPPGTPVSLALEEGL